ncbi:MAG: methyltransferase domain-containing protein [Pseudomonadota bacterium]
MAGAERTLFDFEALRRHRDRAAGLGLAAGADFLHRAAARSLAERLRDVPRRFDRAVLIGAGAGAAAEVLVPALGDATLEAFEPSPALAARSGTAILEGETLPLEAGSADLALSLLLLHHLNDPVGHLIQLRRALRPDSLMLAAMFGGQTLHELRSAFAEAEAELRGGLSPRVAPMGEIRDLGGLLQRAGLEMPVADSERVDVTYETPLHLMRDLRAMGETSVLSARPRGGLRRDLLARMSEIYRMHFLAGHDRVRATFEIVYLTGWSPGPGQPEPLRPGSAGARLADALGTQERPAGEKAPRKT